MIESIIRGLLGPSLSPIVDFIKNNPSILAIILFIFIALYVAGRFQLHAINGKTRDFVMEHCQKEMELKPNISAEALFEAIYPEWAAEVSKWAWFIPHRLDFWPVRVTPDRAKEKLAFSPDWIADLFKANHINLRRVKKSEKKS